MILVTDSMSPDDVGEYGHMDHVIRKAISLRLSPIQAIQLVTLNPATYSGLEQDIGGLAPGRFADVVLIETNLYDDMLKVAVFDRHHNSPKVALGFLKGFGAKVGAVGLTTNLVRCPNLDNAFCRNRLIEQFHDPNFRSQFRA
jgi:adenine deaminase